MIYTVEHYTHLDLIQIEVRSIVIVVAFVLKTFTETNQISSDHGVHNNDESQRDDECQEGVDDVDNSHSFVVTFPHVAQLGASLVPHYPRSDEGVTVADQGHHRQRQDYRLGPGHRAHVRPVEGVLHRYETLYRERDYQPHAEETADGANVDEALTPTVLVEHLDTDVVVQPHHQQCY